MTVWLGNDRVGSELRPSGSRALTLASPVSPASPANCQKDFPRHQEVRRRGSAGLSSQIHSPGLFHAQLLRGISAHCSPRAPAYGRGLRGRGGLAGVRATAELHLAASTADHYLAKVGSPPLAPWLPLLLFTFAWIFPAFSHR